MLSFYVVSPGGFNVEFGWKGLMVDDDTWTVRTYSGRGELWGHTGEFMESIADAKAYLLKNGFEIQYEGNYDSHPDVEVYRQIVVRPSGTHGFLVTFMERRPKTA